MNTTKEKPLADILGKIDTEILAEPRPDLASLVHWRGAETLPIHRWYRYREAYSPDLITHLGLGNRILDPYCGGGSIMVGAAQTHRLSVGIDLNPLAVFVARVKLTPLTESEIALAAQFKDSFRQICPEQVSADVPGLRIAHKVFEPVILETVLKLRTAIEAISERSSRVRDFLLLGWLAILQEVGSYFKEGNGIKYRNKKRLKTGYVARPDGAWQLERFGDDQAGFVYQAFDRQLAGMIADTPKWKTGNWSEQKVIEGSALEMDSVLGTDEFDSIIFSPPYANRFDYFEALKVELWFGGFVSSYGGLNALRKLSVRSHLGADLTRPYTEIPALERLLSMMDPSASSWRMGVPAALRGYFDDMFQTLSQCRKHIPTGCCHVVVGNSAYAGVIIPTDSLIAWLGLHAGFSSAKLLTVRHLTVAPQQRSELQSLAGYMRESVVLLQ